MARVFSKLTLRFFRTEAGREPVREWLKALPKNDRKAIGGEIRTLQLGWPLGMPLVRKLEHDLWEIRISLPHRAGRVFFTIAGGSAILLHGFIKQSQKTPLPELKIAKSRKAQVLTNEETPSNSGA